MPASEAAATVLIVLAFYFYQRGVPGIQGYEPYLRLGHVSYAVRTLYAVLIFFLPLAFVFRWSRRVVACGIAASGFALLAYMVLFVAVRPELDAISDRDDGLELALSQLFQLRYPYQIETQLGGRVTALSGNLILATPGWIAFGRADLATLALVPFCSALLWITCMNPRRIARLVPLQAALWFLPVLNFDAAWGSDLSWPVILLIGSWFFWERDRRTLSIVLLALAICSKAAFLLLVPLHFIWLRKEYPDEGPRFARMLLGLIVLLELPFLLWDAETFLTVAPFGISSGKLGMKFPPSENLITDALNVAFPFEGFFRSAVLTALFVALSAALALRVRETHHLALAAAAVLGTALFFVSGNFLSGYLIWIAVPALYAAARG